jgi:hypothetical protein
MWRCASRRAARSVVGSRPGATRRFHTATSTSHAHIHGPGCAHDHAPHQPTTSAAPLAAASPSVDVALSTPDGRPQPPVLAKGQLPPGDNPHLPGWYQRPLPHSLIPFSSNRGKTIFKEAMNRGGMEGYFALAEQFQTQSTPSCQMRRDTRTYGHAHGSANAIVEADACAS